ncbi:glycosyltransferase involved in cell wall biosynthesis [Tenacibaculum gallaicum]|uniref:Glycosyltransferase involved in cell wall biosynthesis n=1 Tax=Tenacibaculum gallaicum TaxID=561505 RepID=A0A3E0HHU7_9FLAO|nr:glycosyltransferase [Tenacibaculum gallaicum]REH45776.1 glycosyltransferase involved in cell wall biosynthesis [Tenacibaculum gallaicum]
MKEIKVLVVTGILPVSAIEYKKTENDILLVTEDEINSRNKDISFKYIFTFPNANKTLSKASSKWNSYYQLKKEKEFELKGRKLFLFPVFLLPKKVFFRNVLIRLSLFLYRKRIEKIINKYQPTVLHAHNADTSAYIARLLSKKYNIPYIVTLRGLNRIKDEKVKKNLEGARDLIAISSRQIVEGEMFVNKKINFIPHGVGRHFFKNKENKKINQPIRLVTVSRLLKLKNIDLVIKSLSYFEYDFIFDVYGDGGEKHNLSQLIKQHNLGDKVTLKGLINNQDLPSVLLKYDLFIMPSYPETLGRVYFEAMACGLPVIASKNTGIDGLIVDGREGFLLNSLNENEFTEVFHNILYGFISLKIPYKKMSDNAKIYAEQYTWDKIVPKYLKLYENK